MHDFQEQDPKGVGCIPPTAAQQPQTQNALDGMRLQEAIPAPEKANWDIAELRLSQEYSADKADSVQISIPVQKPQKGAYFRAHPDWNFPMAVLVYEDRMYPVFGAALREELEADLKVVIIVPCITRNGDVFLWPLAPLQATGRENEWVTSAHRALAASRKEWIRIRSNMRLRSYDILRPKVSWDDPKWPDQNLEEMIKAAFDGSIINSLDHPVIRALQGDL